MTVFYEDNTSVTTPPLSDLTWSYGNVTDEVIPENNAEITVEKGTVITFAAENATKITVTDVNDNEQSADASSIEFTADADDILTVTAEGVDAEGLPAEITRTIGITVTAPTLGDLTVTLPDGTVATDNGDYTITVGQTITATALHAESIKFYALDANASETVEETTAGDAAAWTADKAYDKMTFSVTASLAGNEDKELTFEVTVVMPTIIDCTVEFINNGSDAQKWGSKYGNGTTITWKSNEASNPFEFETTASVSGSNTYPALYTGDNGDKGLRIYGASNNKITVKAPSAKLFSAIILYSSSNATPTIDGQAMSSTKSRATDTPFSYTFEKPVNSFVLGTSANSGNFAIENITLSLVNDPKTTGIDSIIGDGENDGAAEYFNMQGIRVDNPAGGLYIRRQGNKVEKVIIR